MDKNTPILVVDDYATMLRIIRSLLRQLGFTDVEETADGTSALAKLRQRRFGLVISDWNMQPVSGLDLLREVRGDPELAHLPFIMITVQNRTESLTAAKEAGVTSYIVKPFDAETLRSRIASALSA